MTRVQQAGARIEELLAALGAVSGDAAASAEELVRLLLGLYGDGLGHIMASARRRQARPAWRSGTGCWRIRWWRACFCCMTCILSMWMPGSSARLTGVRPYLGSHAGGVKYLGVSPDGVARLRLEGSCHGCPSSTVTVQLAIEGAVVDAAPEVTDVVVEGMTEPPGPALLQIGRRPGAAAPAESRDGGLGGSLTGEDPGWVSLPGFGPPDGGPP